MLIRIQRRLARLRADDGVSLMELIVYMALAGLVLVMAGTFYVGVARATTQAVDRRTSTAEAQNMMDVLSADIRAGTNVQNSSTSTTWAVLSASTTSLTIVTYTDAGPTFGQPYQVSFTVDNAGRLVLSQWNPPAASPLTFPVSGPPTLTRVLGTGVRNTAIFSYQDSTGAAIPAGGAMAASQYANVASVVVNLVVQAPNSSVSVNMTNTIAMPNAGLATAYAGAN